MIAEFNKQNLKTLRNEIDKALAAVGDKHGLELSIGNIRFDSTEFTTRMTVKTLAGKKQRGEIGLTNQEVKWQQGLNSFSATVHGLNAKMAGTTFMMGEEQFVLVGFRAKAKYQIVARKPGNKTYTVMPATLVAEAIKAAAAA